MLTIILLTAVVVIYAYAQGYGIDRVIGVGLAGIAVGVALFGAQAAFASQPKVPCWTEVHGMAQLFRAMPYACQHTTLSR